jgi:hypothetical protein
MGMGGPTNFRQLLQLGQEISWEESMKRIVQFFLAGAVQCEDAHMIPVNHQGNVYVGDWANKRLSVFDNDGNYKTGYIIVGSPWAICITRGQHQYLYSSNSTGTTDMENNGEIYKMELDGRILGKFGKGGKEMKEFMAVHELDCRTDNEVYAGEISNWRVQKLSLHPTAAEGGK